MATRPLDAAFGGSTEKKSKKRGALLAVGIVAGLASIGSIFAASVNINSGTDPISYSQGTEVIAACDSNGISASLGAWYDANGAAFSLDTISLTDVDALCDGKTLTLKLYQGTSSLVTITGIIESTSLSEVTIGVANEALTDSNFYGDGGDYRLLDNVAENARTLTYAVGKTAADLAADADRIVIEIN